MKNVLETLIERGGGQAEMQLTVEGTAYAGVVRSRRDLDDDYGKVFCMETVGQSVDARGQVRQIRAELYFYAHDAKGVVVRVEEPERRILVRPGIVLPAGNGAS